MTHGSFFGNSHYILTNAPAPNSPIHHLVIAHDLCKNTYSDSDSCNNSTDCVWINETNIDHFGKSIVVPASCTTKKIHE
jgi:hypothetical protein